MRTHGLAAVMIGLAAAPAWAQDWIAPDGRSRAMGNTGVAYTDGPAASYWNPAALAAGGEKPFDFSTGWGFSLYGTVEAVLEGDVSSIVSAVDDAYGFYNFAGSQQAINAGTHTETDVQNALTIVNTILSTDQRGEGVLVNLAAGAEVRVGPFAVFTRAVGTLAGDPFFNFANPIGSALTGTDLNTFFGQLAPPGAPLSPAAQNLSAQLAPIFGAGVDSDGDGTTDADELAFQAQQAVGDAGISNPAFISTMQSIARATVTNAGTGATTSTLYFTDSGTVIRGLIQTEAGIGFGLPLFPTLLEVGIALKEVVSETFYRKITYQEEDENDNLSDAVRDEFKENRKRDSDFNVDLGAIVRPASWVTVGLSVRNLLPMKVSFAGPGDLETDPKIRAGAAFRPVGFFTIGFDVDVLESDSDLLDGYHSRFLGAGFEFDFPVVKLRGGYFDNVADTDTRGTFTAGIGLDVWLFRLDIAGQVGLHENKAQPDSLDGQDEEEVFPDRVSASFTLSVQFGL